MAKLLVCRVDELLEGQMRAFVVDGLGVPVLMANLGGRFVATVGICPHEDVALADGDLDETRIICPGHGYEFDLDTGRCVHDPELRLRRFPVTIQDGEVHIDLDLFALP